MMSALLFRVALFTSLLHPTSCLSPSISFEINGDGSYTLSSAAWPNLLLSSAPVGLLSNGQWLSAADGSLKLAGPMATWTGSDSMGPFSGSTFTWADAKGISQISTTFKVYSESPAVGFAASFPAGISTGSNGTSSKDSVVSAFPSWTIPSASQIGWLQWSGAFVNQGVKGPLSGTWDTTGAKAFSPGISSGPIVLLDESAAASLILSAASEFAAVSAVASSGSLSYGPLGSVDSLPKGYSYETVAWLGAGVNYAVMSWGRALMGKFGKVHGLSRTDFTNTHLHYNTDHGAYYCTLRSGARGAGSTASLSSLYPPNTHLPRNSPQIIIRVIISTSRVFSMPSVSTLPALASRIAEFFSIRIGTSKVMAGV